MKQITVEQTKQATDGLMGFHRPLEFMLRSILGDQYDSVTIVCALKPRARSKKSPALAVVCGTHEYDNTVFAMEQALKAIGEWRDKRTGLKS